MNIDVKTAGMLVILLAGVVLVWFTVIRRRGIDMANETKKYNKDGSINQQWFAEEITRREGKIRQVDIGQIKEIWHVSREILHELYDENPDAVQSLISKNVD